MLRHAPMFALTATILAGCASSGSLNSPPDIPADLRLCFNQVVPAPKQATMTDGEVITLISRLKGSEAEKTECGRRLIAWVDTLRANWK